VGVGTGVLSRILEEIPSSVSGEGMSVAGWAVDLLGMIAIAFGVVSILVSRVWWQLHHLPVGLDVLPPGLLELGLIALLLPCGGVVCCVWWGMLQRCGMGRLHCICMMHHECCCCVALMLLAFRAMVGELHVVGRVAVGGVQLNCFPLGYMWQIILMMQWW